MHLAPRPQRVLALFSQVCANGGIQRFNRTLLAACAVLGAECDVLSLHDTGPTMAAAADTSQLARVIGFSGNRSLFALAAAAWLWNARYDWLLVGHIHFLEMAAAVRVLRAFDRPKIIVIAHGIEAWSGIGPMRRHALLRAEKILCVSEYTRRRILEQAPHLDAAKLCLFPNTLGETWDGVAPAPSVRVRPTRYILSVTRIENGDRYKGVVTVIEALRFVDDDDLHYVVVGQGNDLAFLQDVARRFGVADRVHFLQGVTDSELIELYRGCLAFVLPSGKEGFGIVFLEAMYFGAPVIAAAAKGALDVVEDGTTGLLVPFGDSIAVAKAIERLAVDSGLRAHLIARGRANVVDGGKFTFTRFVERCAAVFGYESAQAMPSAAGSAVRR